MISGVYQLTNKISGGSYIGSSVDVPRRVRRHFSDLRRGVHGNSHLQRSFDRYGETAFEWAILRTVETPPSLVAAEQFFIDLFRPTYNICKVAGSYLGMKQSEETRRKIGAARKGAGNGMFNKKHSPKVIAKIAQASQKRKGLPEVQSALKLGHGWNRGKPFSEAARRKMADAKPKKPVVRIDPLTGERKLYECASSARKDGFCAAHIGACCAGKRKAHKGFLWSYV